MESASQETVLNNSDLDNIPRLTEDNMAYLEGLSRKVSRKVELLIGSKPEKPEEVATEKSPSKNCWADMVLQHLHRTNHLICKIDETIDRL